MAFCPALAASPPADRASGPLAQLVEQRTLNPLVEGSSPSWPTNPVEDPWRGAPDARAAAPFDRCKHGLAHAFIERAEIQLNGGVIRDHVLRRACPSNADVLAEDDIGFWKALREAVIDPDRRTARACGCGRRTGACLAAARRRAHELGGAIEILERSAAGGIIHVEDVERLARQLARPVQQPPAPADARAAMRLAIGAAMARSKREIPHYYLGQAVDFGNAREWLAQHNAAVPVQDWLIETVLIVKAVALAASRVEGFNGHFRDGRFERAQAVHVGTAIALRGGGLVAPALLEAERKDLATLMRQFSALLARVRAGHLRSGEFSAATITVTSLGADGVDVLYPIINPPQVAIVGTGAVRDQPWVSDGELLSRPVLTLALAADHRVTDGRTGARFLRAVADLIARPAAL